MKLASIALSKLSTLETTLKLILICQILFPIAMATPILAPTIEPVSIMFMGHSLFPRSAFDTWPWFEFPIITTIGEIVLLLIWTVVKSIQSIQEGSNPPSKGIFKAISISSYMLIVLSIIPFLLSIQWVIEKTVYYRQSIWMLIGGIGLLSMGLMIRSLFQYLDNTTTNQ